MRFLTSFAAVAVLTLVSTAPVSAHDCSAVISGESRWTLNGVGDWSPLEQLGVRKSAEENAVRNCSVQGYSQCLVVNSYITKCHGWDGTYIGQAECEATATVRGCR